DDGRTIVTTDGADEIRAAPDGREVRAVWKRWAQVGTTPGQLVDPGLSSDVRWSMGGDQLTRVETLTTRAPRTIRTWQLMVPSKASTGRLSTGSAILTMGDEQLSVSVNTPWPVDAQFRATGDAAAGRGARGPIPLHLVYDARDVQIEPGRPL